MKIGVPKEIKNNENRVAITPAGVANMVKNGHQVLIEMGAGLGSGFTDEEFQAAGAKITDDVKQVWQSEMVMKVKEPLAQEYGYFYPNLILFTYLHLAPEPELTKALIEKGVTAIAYESVQLDDGSLPLLAPMSEVAGRMATQVGAHFLEKPHQGEGILLGGVPGVRRGKVVIIGGGIAGTNAAKMAVGLGAQVTILDVSTKRLAELDDLFGNAVSTMISNPYNLEHELKDADLVIGAVLLPGAKAPKLVSEQMVKQMKPGTVLVDVAIDQGGIFESTERVTTHADPIYVKHGVIHYSVANMPGAVPRTSTFALTNVTVPYALRIANKGVKQACLEDSALLRGINVINHKLTIKEVAVAHNLPVACAKEQLVA
ncbi:alanine dehydrogenase [Serratia microhaemolytica]|uniref:alanine dehydrogenase n=1 Tax=Serratia microhaemolytica TaxID=2675110 RepID=UPI000FDF4B56